MFIHIKTNYDIKFRDLIVVALFMVRAVLGDGSPSKITLYTVKNNCTKFDAFVHFVPISSKSTTKQPDYYTSLHISKLCSLLEHVMGLGLLLVSCVLKVFNSVSLL